MAHKKVNDGQVMELYNSSGCKATKEYIGAEYRVAYPACVITKLKKDPQNGYDQSTDKFKGMEKAPFLDLKELCAVSEKTPPISQERNAGKYSGISEWIPNETSNWMFQELAMEKLVEMSKYISFNYAVGQCRINKKALDLAGYRVEIY